MNHDFSNIGEEAYTYLSKSNALLEKPIDRLLKMNPLAIDIYKNHGIDLHTERLEIKVCAQNHNGGLLVDAFWRTNLQHFSVCGEAAGTFGPYRPGGSALNSTQVSSLRAVQDIVFNYGEKKEFFLGEQEREAIANFESLVGKLKKDTGILPKEIREHFAQSMSKYAGFYRNLEKMQELEKEIEGVIDTYFSTVQIDPQYSVVEVFTTYDSLITTKVILQAMIQGAKGQGSLGGAIVTQKDVVMPLVVQETNERLVSTLDTCAFEVLKTKEMADLWFEKNWEEHREIRKIRE
jgi:succinate dehydrogenase/fumarate reductase flavoprotein subunit